MLLMGNPSSRCPRRVPSDLVAAALLPDNGSSLSNATFHNIPTVTVAGTKSKGPQTPKGPRPLMWVVVVLAEVQLVLFLGSSSSRREDGTAPIQAKTAPRNINVMICPRAETPGPPNTAKVAPRASHNPVGLHTQGGMVGQKCFRGFGYMILFRPDGTKMANSANSGKVRCCEMLVVDEDSDRMLWMVVGIMDTDDSTAAVGTNIMIANGNRNTTVPEQVQGVNSR